MPVSFQQRERDLSRFAWEEEICFKRDELKTEPEQSMQTSHTEGENKWKKVSAPQLKVVVGFSLSLFLGQRPDCFNVFH